MRDHDVRALVDGVVTARLFPLLHAYLTSAEILTEDVRWAIIAEFNDYYVGDIEPEDIIDEVEL